MDVVTASAFVIGLGVVPVLYVRWRGRAAWRWFALGIASWALALVFKVGLQLGVEALPAPAIGKGMLAGVISAACELGAAALFLRRRDLRGGDLIAFGVGIGAFEVLFAAVLSVTQDAAPEAKWVACLAFGIERSVTMVGHVASRVLVHVSLRVRRLLPALIAMGAFATVDGVAATGSEAGWNWDAPQVLFPFLGFVTLVGGLEAWAAWWSWRQTDLRWAAA